MKLPFPGSTVAEVVRVGTMVTSGVATFWAFKSGHKVWGTAFLGITLASAFLTNVVPSRSLDADVDDEEDDSLENALADYCKDPESTVSKVNDIEKALNLQIADKSSDVATKKISVDGLADIARFRQIISSGGACPTK